MTKIEHETSEDRFRSAYHRLLDGNPRVLPKGTTISQTNVAREAGCDPSALKKSRHPSLVAEIQAAQVFVPSKRESEKAPCSQCSRLREQLKTLSLQRDQAMSALASADEHLMELNAEVLRLRRILDEAKPNKAATLFHHPAAL